MEGLVIKPKTLFNGSYTKEGKKFLIRENFINMFGYKSSESWRKKNRKNFTDSSGNLTILPYIVPERHHSRFSKKHILTRNCIYHLSSYTLYKKHKRNDKTH